jgi:hypothetical protein
MPEKNSDELRTDVYQDHAEPDSPPTGLRRIDSAVDVMIAAMQMRGDTDAV